MPSVLVNAVCSAGLTLVRLDCIQLMYIPHLEGYPHSGASVHLFDKKVHRRKSF